MTALIVSASGQNIKPFIDPAINPETGKKWHRSRRIAINPTDYSLDGYGNLTIIDTGKALASMPCFGDGVVRAPGRRDSLKSYRNGKRTIVNGCAGCPIAAHCDKVTNTRLHKHRDLADAHTDYANATALMSKADAVASPEYQAFAAAWIAKGFTSNALEVMNADQLRMRIARATPEAKGSLVERAALIPGSVQAKEVEKAQAQARRRKPISNAITSYHEGVARSRLVALKAAMAIESGKVRHLRRLTAEGAALRVDVAMWQDILASAKEAPEGPAAIARRMMPFADTAAVRAKSKLIDKALSSVIAIRASGIWDDCQFQPETFTMPAQTVPSLSDADLDALADLDNNAGDAGATKPMIAERVARQAIARQQEENAAGIITDPERPDIDAYEDNRALRAGYADAPAAVAAGRGGAIVREFAQPMEAPAVAAPKPAQTSTADLSALDQLDDLGDLSDWPDIDSLAPTMTMGGDIDAALASASILVREALKPHRVVALDPANDPAPEPEPALMEVANPADATLLDIYRETAAA